MIAATFVLQPLNLRPYGLPVSLVLIAIFAAVAALKEGRLSFSRDVLFFAPIFIILFVVDFLVAGQTRSLVFLILIIFVRFCGASFSGKQLSDTLFIVGLVCFFVSLVGVYRITLVMIFKTPRIRVAYLKSLLGILTWEYLICPVRATAMRYTLR